MKNKKIVITAIALALCLALSSCGSSFSSYKSEPQTSEAEYYNGGDYGFMADNSIRYASKDGAYDEEAYSSAGSSMGTQNYDPEKVKLIYRANLEIQATDFDETVSAVEKLVAEHGGYFESRNVYNGNYYSDGTYKRGNYTVRIPSENYDSFVNAVGGSCYVSNKSESVEDIGLQYADTEAMLETLRIKQARLQELLKEASGLSDIIQLENALSDTEYQINRYSSTKNRYDSLIGYATVNISIEKVSRVIDGIDQDESFLSRLGRSFSNGAHDFVEGLGNFVISLAYNIIPLALAALILAFLFKKGVFGGIARWMRERNMRSAARKAEKKAARAAKGEGSSKPAPEEEKAYGDKDGKKEE